MGACKKDSTATTPSVVNHVAQHDSIHPSIQDTLAGLYYCANHYLCQDYTTGQVVFDTIIGYDSVKVTKCLSNVNALFINGDSVCMVARVNTEVVYYSEIYFYINTSIISDQYYSSTDAGFHYTYRYYYKGRKLF
jgi:hypothetical protein